jgi:hypothetical protein
MAEWIITICTILGVLVAVIIFFMKLAKFETAYYAKHQALQEHVDEQYSAVKDKVQELKEVIGNGNNQGLRAEIKGMQIYCSGHMSSVETRLKSLEKGEKQHG